MRAANVARGADANPYLEDEDAVVAELGVSAAAAYCAEAEHTALDAERREVAREVLREGLGGQNILLETLRDSDTNAELPTNLSNKITLGFLIAKVAPVTMAIVVPMLWCCSSCGACCCCRGGCGKTKSDLPLVLQATVPLAVAMMFAGLSTCVGLASDGYYAAKGGLANNACTSGRILSDTLEGQGGGEQPFVGIRYVLDLFWTLHQDLENSSGFFTAASDLLNRTAELDRAAQLANETLLLMRDTTATQANTDPKDRDGASLLHRCLFCSALAPSLTAAAETFEASRFAALAAARGEVEFHLAPLQRMVAQLTVRGAAASLAGFKEVIRGTFSFFLREHGFDVLRAQMTSNVLYGLSFVFCFALAVMSCGCCAGTWWFGRGVRQAVRGGGEAKGAKGARKCACWSWQCGCLYTFLIFLIGGLVTAIAVPLCGMCLLMDSLDRQMIMDIGPAVGMNLTGDMGTMLLDLVDGCVVGANLPASTNILDLLFARLNANESYIGDKVALRAKLVGDVHAPLVAAWARLDAALDSGPATLADHPATLSLRALLRDNPIDKMIVVDEDRMRSDSTLAKLCQDQRCITGGCGVECLAVGYSASSSCDSHLVQGPALGDLHGTGIPGISNFTAMLSYYGANITANCSTRVVCQAGNTLPAQVCAAGNAYADLKSGVVESDRFRCDLFEDPSDTSAACDPKDTATAGPPFAGDCTSSGEPAFGPGPPRRGPVRKERNCTLPEFVRYMADFDARLQRALGRLDAAAVQALATVNEDLRNLIARHMVEPLGRVAEGLACDYFPPRFRDMIDALCFQGVRGFLTVGNSFVVSAVLVMFLLPVMFVLWCWGLAPVDRPQGDVQVGAVSSIAGATKLLNPATKQVVSIHQPPVPAESH